MVSEFAKQIFMIEGFVGLGVILTLLVVNFLMGGFFGAFMRVKMSRGKKLLVRVLHPVQSYFKAGDLTEGFLIYKDRQGNDRRILYTEGCIDRGATVYWTTVDEEKNCMVRRIDGKGIDGHDAVKTDELYKRALYKPNMIDQRIAIFTLIIVVVMLLIVIGVAVLSFKNMQGINALREIIAVPATTGVVA